jgi:rhodanese-related sulfurtransferase
MSCEKVKEYLEQGWTLIDVRTQAEYNNGHIKDAQLVEMTDVQNLSDGRYLVYCRSGARSGSAAAYLNSKGIEAINIGGITQYMGCLNF